MKYVRQKLRDTPLYWRIFITMVLVVLIFSVALSTAVTSMVRAQNLEMGILEIQNDAHMIAAYYNINTQLLRSRVFMGDALLLNAMAQVVQKNNAPVWFFNRLGRQFSVAPLEPQQQVLTAEEASALVTRVVDGGERVFVNAFNRALGGVQSVTVGMPLTDADGAVSGAVIVNAQVSNLQRGLSAFVSQLVGVAAAALLVGLALAAYVARRATQPMVEMAQTARAMARGDFTKRVPVRGNDETGHLAQSFNDMADELGNLEEVRAAFVANVSHELRSPLTSIRGYVQGMLDGTIPAEDHMHYMGIVDEEAQRLTSLVRDLLDLSRIEAGSVPLDMQVFDINELICRVLIRLEGRLNEKQLQAETLFRSDSLSVKADPARIEQVVYNLLDNAVKFSNAGGSLSVATHAGGGKAVIAVSDEGEGIVETDLPFIFDRFFKADKAHSGGGTGLGLSIVKRIVEAHEEEIRATSTPGKGATFVFTLPLAP